MVLLHWTGGTVVWSVRRTCRKGSVAFFYLCLRGWETTVHSFLILLFFQERKDFIRFRGKERWVVAV